ncbi:MAG: hypothetical protein PHP34_09985 [Bacteroidales bacterium]|nr:hypothetical protein [Bacteroidales bacterium]
MKTKFLLLFCVLTVSTTLSAATITVTSNAASGENSLVAAVTAAATSDTIAFNFDGTEISLTDVIAMKSLYINGKNAFNNKAVILKQSNTAKSFFTFATGITAKLSDLVFDGISVNANTAITAANGSTLSIERCVFKNIIAQGNNGGAARLQGKASIKNSSFENNASSGGYGGGALCIYNAAEISIDNCSFIGNTANINGTNKNGGGAIVARGTVATTCKVSITNSTFANNTAALTGGALMASVQSSSAYIVNIDAVNCTFTGNKGLGAICAHTTVKGSANIHLVNSIVLNNVDTATIASYSDILEVKGTDAATVALVTPQNMIYSVAPTIVTTGKNCIQVADPSTADIFNAYETFATDKKRPVLSTVDLMTVVMISSASQAKGAGIATLEGYTIPTTDQLGTTRPATPSIGAVEYKQLSNIPTETSPILSFYVRNREIFIYGLSEPTAANIYNIQGMLLKKATLNNHTSVNMENIPGNLFFVKIGNSTFKVLVH